MIEPGTYLAKVASHSITENKGKPQVAVTFSVKANDKEQKITWYGHFTEKSTPYTIKNLLTCGLQGNNPAGPLTIGKEVELVIDDELGEDQKMRTKVKYINEIGITRNAVPQDLAIAKLASLEGAVMAARQKLNINEEIPF